MLGKVEMERLGLCQWYQTCWQCDSKALPDITVTSWLKLGRLQYLTRCRSSGTNGVKMCKTFQSIKSKSFLFVRLWFQFLLDVFTALLFYSLLIPSSDVTESLSHHWSVDTTGSTAHQRVCGSGRSWLQRVRSYPGFGASARGCPPNPLQSEATAPQSGLLCGDSCFTTSSLAVMSESKGQDKDRDWIVKHVHTDMWDISPAPLTFKTFSWRFGWYIYRLLPGAGEEDWHHFRDHLLSWNNTQANN